MTLAMRRRRAALGPADAQNVLTTKGYCFDYLTMVNTLSV
jgi:hypothetical protein